MQQIDAVVFDVGRVLVDLESGPLMQCFENGSSYSIPELISAIDLDAHERGEICGEQLIDNLHSLAPTASREKLKQVWLDMFSPVESMWQLAKALARRSQVYLLSNMGELHWFHLHHRFELHSLAHDVLPSFEAGVMKPHTDIYRQAEQRFGICVEQSVFIDDLEQNVLAACDRGWHAIHHQSPGQTMTELRALGVEW